MGPTPAPANTLAPTPTPAPETLAPTWGVQPRRLHQQDRVLPRHLGLRQEGHQREGRQPGGPDDRGFILLPIVSAQSDGHVSRAAFRGSSGLQFGLAASVWRSFLPASSALFWQPQLGAG